MVSTSSDTQSSDTQTISYQEFENKIVSTAGLSHVDFSRIINELSNIKYIAYSNGTTKNVNVAQALVEANRNRRSNTTNNQTDVVELADRLINQFEIPTHSHVAPGTPIHLNTPTASTASTASDVNIIPRRLDYDTPTASTASTASDVNELPASPVLIRQNASYDENSVNSIVGGKKKRKLMKKKTKSKRKLTNKKSMRKSKKNINKKKKSQKKGFERKIRKHNSTKNSKSGKK